MKFDFIIQEWIVFYVMVIESQADNTFEELHKLSSCIMSAVSHNLKINLEFPDEFMVDFADKNIIQRKICLKIAF